MNAVNLLEAIRDWCNDKFTKKTELPTKVSQLENDSGYIVSNDDASNLKSKVTKPASMFFYYNTDENGRVCLDLKDNEPLYLLFARINGVFRFLSPLATTGKYSDLIGVPTKVSEFENDSGFVTSDHTHGSMKTITYSTTEPTTVAEGEIVMVYEDSSTPPPNNSD